ncbi:LapA family protein [Thiohalophilus sp.]|uniref:LapA family protein n=1 Tax=Thiohalophilus sp. TaxID=3028392 RepID=UPI002ACE5FC8|nr:LapA family protein [Thiohalophilus sp.]MDZ7662769.1 LapA family protein [Thiohalophilus sp.]
MLKIIYIAVIVLLVITGLVFAVLNAEPVAFNYYFDTLSIPLSLSMLVAMIIGAILGVLASAGVILRHKREIARLRKAVDMSEKEINNLRSIPLRDDH